MRIAATAFLSLLLVPAAAPPAPSSQAPAAASVPAAPPAPACATPEHRQFDFWVGRWDVYATGTDRLVARSLIERLYADCAVRENWMPLQGPGGGSLNSWLPRERMWRQTWVDGGNSYAVFEGNYENEEMVLTGVWAGAAGPGTTPLIRIHWSRVDSGAVRQRGEQSTDNGRTWTPNFDLTYRPAAVTRSEAGEAR